MLGTLCTVPLSCCCCCCMHVVKTCRDVLLDGSHLFGLNIRLRRQERQADGELILKIARFLPQTGFLNTATTMKIEYPLNFPKSCATVPQQPTHGRNFACCKQIKTDKRTESELKILDRILSKLGQHPRCFLLAQWNTCISIPFPPTIDRINVKFTSSE